MQQQEKIMSNVRIVFLHLYHRGTNLGALEGSREGTSEGMDEGTTDMVGVTLGTSEQKNDWI